MVGGQWHLQGAGFYPQASIDGLFGNGSFNATIQFQNAVGCTPATGGVGPCTWRVMRERTDFLYPIAGGSESAYTVENRSDEIFHRINGNKRWYVRRLNGVYRTMGIADCNPRCFAPTVGASLLAAPTLEATGDQRRQRAAHHPQSAGRHR